MMIVKWCYVGEITGDVPIVAIVFIIGSTVI